MMNFKRLILILLIQCVFLQGIFSNGNEDYTKNSFYLELGGSGYITSINFKYNFLNSSTHEISSSLGLSYFPSFINDQMKKGTLILPIGLHYSYRIQKSSHKIFISSHLVTNIGEKYFLDELWTEITFSFVNSLGYEYNKPSSNFYYYAGYSPRIHWLDITLRDERIIYSHGLCLGMGRKF